MQEEPFPSGRSEPAAGPLARALLLAGTAAALLGLGAAARRYTDLVGALGPESFSALGRGTGPAERREAPEPEPARPGESVLRLRAPGARAVAVAGDFNGWTPVPLEKKGDWWEARLTGVPERSGYLYKVDERWTTDPANPAVAHRGPTVVSVLGAP